MPGLTPANRPWDRMSTGPAGPSPAGQTQVWELGAPGRQGRNRAGRRLLNHAFYARNGHQRSTFHASDGLSEW
jgi:hypothetical protein